jgi:2,5-dihydroxypyridine 5,6-dioxygenase
MTQNLDMIRLFKAELALCKVTPEETLVVLTEGEDKRDYADAFLAAAAEIGATSFQLNLTKRTARPADKVKRTSLSGNQPAIEALKGADIVIDLVGLLWSAEQKEITDTGTRMLLVREPFEVLARMFPRESLRHRVEAAQRLLAGAQELRISSPAGTDVTYRLGAYPVITQYGYTDTPGRWDHFAGGFVYTGAYDDGVDGRVVINTGDILYPFMRYASEPIALTIERGRVTRIDAAGVDGELLRTFIQRFNDPRAYAISHIGWGLDETALWDYMGTARNGANATGCDGRAYYGNVLFSTGPNQELGGKNDTPCHLDMPLRNCTVRLDGKCIIENGTILPKELRAEGM